LARTIPASTRTSAVTGFAASRVPASTGLLQVADIDDTNTTRLCWFEAALRQAAMDWHLAAFESFNAHAGTGRLAFAAATAGFSLAAADAATHAHAAFMGAFVVFNSFSILFHHFHEMFHRINHAANGGVSSSVLVRCSLFRPDR